MREMAETDAVYRVVVIATHAVPGSEWVDTTRTTYGPYSTRGAASQGLTRALKRRYSAFGATGWVERAMPVWEKASPTKEALS